MGTRASERSADRAEERSHVVEVGLGHLDLERVVGGHVRPRVTFVIYGSGGAAG
jgi:hypothetical protein